jgi:hypothetical protein
MRPGLLISNPGALELLTLKIWKSSQLRVFRHTATANFSYFIKAAPRL